MKNYSFDQEEYQLDSISEISRVGFCTDGILFGVNVQWRGFLHDEIDEICDQVLVNEKLVKIWNVNGIYDKPFKEFEITIDSQPVFGYIRMK